ncbi:hypothetical protein BBJ28_00020518 [Nothophytophthora sp. Chile5]|nr:hypothetical protein BBJ28_00020518 [Nothophytophthora sp. Chile5]
MNVLALIAYAAVVASTTLVSAADALDMTTMHLRVLTEDGTACTITKESQCDGQNWTGSTCCEDPSYECRWSDNNQDVKRCQKKFGV